MTPPSLSRSLFSRQERSRAPSACSGRPRAGRQGGRGGPDLGLAGREGATARGTGRAARAAAYRPPRLPGAPLTVLASSGQPQRGCPDAGRWLTGGSRPGGAGRGAGVRALRQASEGPGRGPRASPLPPPPHCPRPSRATSSPPLAARGQTRPRAEDPRGRDGRRGEVASPRQGILNYRLKASKTVHHIFHVSADGRDKRKHTALRGKMAPSQTSFFFFFFSSPSLFYYLCKCKMH